MKQIITLLCLGFLYHISLGATKPIETKVEAVTIYLNGAEITRNHTMTLKKGKQELIFTDLSNRLNAQSLRIVSSKNEVDVLSISSQINFMKQSTVNPRIKRIQDSIELHNITLQDYTDQNTAYQTELQLIGANQKIGGSQTGLTTAELQKAADFTRKRILEIKRAQTKINRDRRNTTNTIQTLQRQLNELNASNRRYVSELYVTINAKQAITTTFTINYLVSNTGWSPIYDLKAKDLNQPVNLKYKAMAYNDTGIEWNNVKVTLSTADPNKSADKPFLQPWYLKDYNPYAYKKDNPNKLYEGAQRPNAPADYSMNSIQLLQNNVIVQSQTEKRESNTQSVNIRFEEVEVNQISKDFEITERYSIPSNRKPYTIDILEKDLPAQFRHYTVPKLDKDAFLLARVTGWQDLDLISGPMNVYKDNRYIGSANLDTRVISDTLDLSLGRDNKVLVTRVLQKEMSKKTTFGGDRKTEMVYKMSVKNNHNHEITIVLEDQIPLSNDKETTVKLLESSQANYKEKTGKLSWTLKVPSYKKEVVSFGYMVKAPKSKSFKLKQTRTISTPRFF